MSQKVGLWFYSQIFRCRNPKTVKVKMSRFATVDTAQPETESVTENETNNVDVENTANLDQNGTESSIVGGIIDHQTLKEVSMEIDKIRNTLLQTLSLHPYLETIIACLLIIFGLFNCLAGYRFFKVYLASVGVLIGALSALVVEQKLASNHIIEPTQLTTWGFLIVSMILGGILSKFLYKAAIYVAAAFAGYQLATWINAMPIVLASENRQFISLIVVAFCILGALLLMRLFARLFSIIITASSGALLVTLSMDHFLQTGFKRAFWVASVGDWDNAKSEFDPKIYYLAMGTVVLSIVGFLVQMTLWCSAIEDEAKNKKLSDSP